MDSTCFLIECICEPGATLDAGSHGETLTSVLRERAFSLLSRTICKIKPVVFSVIFWDVRYVRERKKNEGGK